MASFDENNRRVQRSSQRSEQSGSQRAGQRENQRAGQQVQRVRSTQQRSAQAQRSTQAQRMPRHSAGASSSHSVNVQRGARTMYGANTSQIGNSQHTNAVNSQCGTNATHSGAASTSRVGAANQQRARTTNSQRAANSTITPQVESMSRRSGNAAAAGISNPRNAKRANKGYVHQITPNTTSGESAGAYSRRMNQRDFSQEVRRKSRVKSVLFVLLALILVLGIAAGAAYFAFFASVDSKLSAGSDEKLKSTLVSAEQGQAFYTLLCADLNDTNGSNNIDAALLVRYDQTTNQVTLVAIPGITRVTTSDSDVTLSSVLASGGASGVVSAVSSLTGVDISHYVHIDKTGFVQIVNDLGGITLTVDEVVDDPTAGSIYISPGEQTLNGQAAAVYLAASNYKDGTETQLGCQLSFARALATSFFSSNSFSLESNLDQLSSHIVTDLTARELQDYLGKLQNIQGENIYVAQIQGTTQTSTEHGTTTTLFYPTSSNVTAIMEKVEAGEDPSVLQQQEQNISVDKESFEITVRNGSGITGGATSLAQILTDAGYTVAETGNADSYVYTETLVIYLDSEYKEACEAVVQSLGIGRVVNGVNGYTFDTEVLVVLGSDWKPLS